MAKQEIPQAQCRDITYGRIVCNYCPKKKNPHRTHITMGENLTNYPDYCGTPTADILTAELMFNSIISTPSSKFMTINIKEFFLMMHMDRYEYFRMKLKLFPQDIFDKYALCDKVDADSNVFCEVQCGMYDLPQAGIIAQELLAKRLHKAGYRQGTITPGYRQHDWGPISFALVINNFGMKYINKNNVRWLTPTGKEHNTSDSHSAGTTKSTRNIFPFQATLRMPSSGSATNFLTSRKCNHIPTHFPRTAQQYNMQKQTTHLQWQPTWRGSTFAK
jgi:hypothetical protein